MRYTCPFCGFSVHAYGDNVPLAHECIIEHQSLHCLGVLPDDDLYGGVE